MPFLARGEDLRWHEKQSIRLNQITSKSRRTLFTFDEEIVYTVDAVPKHPGGRADVIEVDATVAAGYSGRIPGHPNRSKDIAALQRYTRTDLASVPQVLWGVFPSYGKYTACAVMHDRLCLDAEYFGSRGGRDSTPGLVRRERRRADQLFRCSLADVGQLRTARRWLMWAAVRVFGFPTVAISTVALAVTFMVFLVLLVLGSGPWDEVERALVSAFPTILAVVGLAWVIALGHNGLETIEPWSGNRKLRVSPAAICSMAGGSGIFVLACPIIVPVLVVTMLTRLAILVLDLMGDGICWMARFGRRRDRFTIYRLIPEVHLYGPPPMRTQVDAGPPETELPPDDGVRVIDRSQALKLGMPVRYANPDAEWVLGLIVNDDADYQVQAQVQKWIESRFEAP